MTRIARLTAVQPSCPDKVLRNDDMLKIAYDLTIEAGEAGSDAVLLPELINTFEIEGVDADVMQMAAPERVGALKAQYSALAKRFGMYIILPVGEARGDELYNSAILFGRDGEEIGHYDKTHISQPELLLYANIRGGSEFPVFDLDFGRVGIMTCYDCNFPEVAIIYARKGVDVLFYPRWQSGPSEISFEIQMRARAIDHAVFVVSSSFGVRDGVPWKPGMLFGRSCVIGRDGTILADAAHLTGIATARVDIDRPHLMECLDESQGQGLIKNLSELLKEDRRPELYQEIVERELLAVK